AATFAQTPRDNTDLLHHKKLWRELVSRLNYNVFESTHQGKAMEPQQTWGAFCTTPLLSALAPRYRVPDERARNDEPDAKAGGAWADQEVTQPRMRAGHEQLREFDRTREGDEPRGEQAASLHIAHSEGQPEHQMDEEMLRAVARRCDRTIGRRAQGEESDG